METAESRGALLSEETPHELFAALVTKNYSLVGVRDEAVTEYVIALLEQFVSMRALRALRNAAGEPLETVAAMLIASNPVQGEADSFQREAEVRRHIGDFTLFLTGMFPEGVRHRRGADALLDFVAAGKESYRIVSEYERTRHSCEPEFAALAAPETGARAPLFARLSAEFERCMYGLNLMQGEIASFGTPAYREVRRLLM